MSESTLQPFREKESEKGGEISPLTLEKIRTKQITVGIVGMGYVGVPLALAFAGEGVKIVGFDVDESKVSLINRGMSFYRHIPKESFLPLVKKKLLSATHDFSLAASCDALIICVPTPLTENLEPDLQYIVKSCQSIAPHVKPGSLISLESTTWPGTLCEVVIPLFDKEKKLHFCYSPEREDPGNKLYTTKTIPKLVSGIDCESRKLGEALYSIAVEKVISMKSTKAVEAAKLFENIFRSVNIALVNELKTIMDEMGIDIWEVIGAASTKPFGFMPFSPGPGLGGHCIPIDPYYLSWKAKQFGINTRFIELAGEINRNMPKYVVGKVQDCLNMFEKPLMGSRILILGLAYKADIDDMRESPSLELMRLLSDKGAVVDYHDPLLPVITPNRRYSDFVGKSSQPLSDRYECFLIATAHSCFSAKEILSHGVPVVDTRNFLPKNDNVFSA